MVKLKRRPSCCTHIVVPWDIVATIMLRHVMSLKRGVEVCRTVMRGKLINIILYKNTEFDMTRVGLHFRQCGVSLFIPMRIRNVIVYLDTPVIIKVHRSGFPMNICTRKIFVITRINNIGDIAKSIVAMHIKDTICNSQLKLCMLYLWVLWNRLFFAHQWIVRTLHV